MLALLLPQTCSKEGHHDSHPVQNTRSTTCLWRSLLMTRETASAMSLAHRSPLLMQTMLLRHGSNSRMYQVHSIRQLLSCTGKSTSPQRLLLLCQMVAHILFNKIMTISSLRPVLDESSPLFRRAFVRTHTLPKYNVMSTQSRMPGTVSWSLVEVQ